MVAEQNFLREWDACQHEATAEVVAERYQKQIEEMYEQAEEAGPPPE